MKQHASIIQLIKNSIYSLEPEAVLILYGSYARGNYKKYSDIDILVLLDKDKVSRADQKRIKYPLYEIEFETGKIISPLVFSKNEWENKHKPTPFYENVMKEGMKL